MYKLFFLPLSKTPYHIGLPALVFQHYFASLPILLKTTPGFGAFAKSPFCRFFGYRHPSAKFYVPGSENTRRVVYRSDIHS